MLEIYRDAIAGAAPAFPSGMEARITAFLRLATPLAPHECGCRPADPAEVEVCQ
jgi:hypothetical protein